MSLKKAALVLEAANEMLIDGDEITGHRAWTPKCHILTTALNREIIIRTIPDRILLEYFYSPRELGRSITFRHLHLSKD